MEGQMEKTKRGREAGGGGRTTSVGNQRHGDGWFAAGKVLRSYPM